MSQFSFVLLTSNGISLSLSLEFTLISKLIFNNDKIVDAQILLYILAPSKTQLTSCIAQGRIPGF